jgi:hypothetical protein
MATCPCPPSQPPPPPPPHTLQPATAPPTLHQLLVRVLQPRQRPRQRSHALGRNVAFAPHRVAQGAAQPRVVEAQLGASLRRGAAQRRTVPPAQSQQRPNAWQPASPLLHEGGVLPARVQVQACASGFCCWAWLLG